ncbi:NAD(P)-dependent benzaldehyde dehydrogenase [Balamuthia mandrillaris]
MEAKDQEKHKGKAITPEAEEEGQQEEEQQLQFTPVSSIPDVVKSLRKAFASGKTKSADWRRENLKGVKHMLEENEEVFLAALNKDLGRCKTESILSEILLTKREAEHAIANLKNWMHPTKVSTPLAQVKLLSSSAIQTQPLGVVLIIAPWNYPLNLVLAPLIGAIAAGNAVLVKPSEVASHTAQAITTLLPKYLDEEAIKVINGAVPETKALLQEKFDHIFFTGSTQVGKIVMRAAAEHLTPVTLELGGKSPCIVDEEIDLDATCRRIVWGKFWNAGQTCIAPDYLLVHKKVEEKFMQKLLATVQDFFGDNPKESPDFGRIINTNHVQRLQSYLQELSLTKESEDGGSSSEKQKDDEEAAQPKLLCGGEIIEEERYISPTIVKDPPMQSKLMQEEIFGPILPVITVKDVDEAIEIINSKPKPLSLYLFTRNPKSTEQVLENTSSGGALINDTLMHFTTSSLPFGGVGDSGMGAYHGKASFDAFSHHRSVLDKTTHLDFAMRYPPYSDKKLNQLTMLL